MISASFSSNDCKTIVSCYSPTNASNEMDMLLFYKELSSLFRYIVKQSPVGWGCRIPPNASFFLQCSELNDQKKRNFESGKMQVLYKVKITLIYIQDEILFDQTNLLITLSLLSLSRHSDSTDFPDSLSLSLSLLLSLSLSLISLSLSLSLSLVPLSSNSHCRSSKLYLE